MAKSSPTTIWEEIQYEYTSAGITVFLQFGNYIFICGGWHFRISP